MKKTTLTVRHYFVGFSALYCVIAVLMNIYAMKPLGTENLMVCDAGLTISWLVFLIANIITEVWGRKEAERLFTFATVLSLSFAVLAALLVKIPSPAPEQAEAFKLIFSNGPRTILASVSAFWVGNWVNVVIIDKIKSKISHDSNVKFFSRSAISTFIGQIVDNAMFEVLAFAPLGISVFELTWSQILTAVVLGSLLELAVESLFVPLITIPCTKHIQNLIKKESAN